MQKIQLNTISLNYDVIGDLASDTIPLVFIHGLGSSLRDWEKQIAYFKDRYTILVFDLRGHYLSDKPDIPYTVTMFTQDTIQLLDALHIQRCHIIGLSLGGMIAFELALKIPHRIQSMTIVNSAPMVKFPSLKVRLAFNMRKWSVRLFGMKHLSQTLAYKVLPKPEQAELRKVFIERWNENDPKAYVNALHAFENWDLSARLNEIACPTLIIGGSRDYTSFEFKQSYAKSIRNARCILVQDSGHITPADQTAQFNQILDDFLQGLAH